MAENKGRKGPLKVILSRAAPLAELIDYSEDSIVSKTILDKSAGTITLFAFDAGQALSEHQAPFDAIVQIIDGAAKISIGPEEFSVTDGQIVIMPANVPHSVAAAGRFKMLLTMIR